MHAEIAVIGGSGLYSLFGQNAAEHKVDTPFGEPSDVITIAQVAGRQVAFLPRHGTGHKYPAHTIPYRANLWALRSLGCQQILAPCAVGGLQPHLGPGSFVIPDQLIDYTSGREHTFYDSGAVHINFADPYCSRLRNCIVDTFYKAGQAVTGDGAMVVINGPRFSTRAESRSYTAMGGSVINMTGAPEAVLARELAMCYMPIALVTDLDAGVAGDRGVTQAEVFRVFADNIDKLRELLLAVVASLGTSRDCGCDSALAGMTLPFDLP